MFGFFKNKLAAENATAGLRYFQSRHRIDDAYLADLLREATPTEEIASDIAKMCQIVESALTPLQMAAHLSGGRGRPNDEATIGYLFGWLDVFKTHIWHVRDFNRSFFHYGFLLWFGDSGSDPSDRFQTAMSAMMCLGESISNTPHKWKAAAQRGRDEAHDFLKNQKFPMGPGK